MFFFVPPASAADWIELENCRLVKNNFNDGDSFIIESAEAYRGRTQNRFRLYFVDAAETDTNSDFKKERLAEQAQYWEQDDPDFALKMGLRAGQFVRRLLRGRFTVYTAGEYAPTMGMPRYYAMIRMDDRWLNEILVEEGLARIYGQGTDLPDGTAEQRHWNRLQRLERAAKAERKSGWLGRVSEKTEEPAECTPYDAVTSRTAWIYSVKDGRKVTVLAKGTPVTVVAQADGTRLRIRFEKNGKVYEGLCEKSSLD